MLGLRSFRLSSLLLVLAPSVLGGCASAVDQRALDGVHALDACDLRGADAAFSDAHGMDPNRADIALAYGLTELATLAEDPALTALAPRFGFDRTIDTSLLWGQGGYLDLLAQHASCDAITELTNTRFPHPSVRPGGVDFWSTIDPTLTIGEVRTALVALSPRLHRIAQALETAARGMDAGGVTLSGGCGVGSTPTRVQAPELLAAAAALEAVRAVAQVALAYDGSLTIAQLFDPHAQLDDRVAAFNAHLLHVTDPSQLEAGRTMLEDATGIGMMAIDAADAASVATHPSDAIFDWTALPRVVLTDVRAFGTAVMVGLPTDTATPIPELSPALGLRLGSFVTDPYDMTADGPLWSLDTTSSPGYPFVQFDSVTFQHGFAERFDQDPFAATAPSRSFSTNWNAFTDDPFGRTFNPAGRWTGGFGCTSTVTP